MKYEEYRNKIKSGDLIAIDHKEWSSLKDLQIQAVKFFTQSTYSHTALVWKVSGRLMVLESVEPVVRMIHLSEYAKQGFYHLPLKKSMSSQELEFALSLVGNGKYSKWQAIRAFFKTLKIGKDKLWECCEYVITCRRLSGIDLGDVATPEKVVQAALEQGSTLTFVKE